MTRLLTLASRVYELDVTGSRDRGGHKGQQEVSLERERSG